jgi:hypothetical protein
MVEKLSLGQVFLPVLRFSPVSRIPPLPCPYLHLYFALNVRKNGRSLGIFQDAVLFGNQGALLKKNFNFLAVSRWPLTSETPVRSQGRPIKFMMTKVILGQFVLFGYFGFSPVSIIPSMLHTQHSLQSGKTGEAWERSRKRNALSDIGGN